MTPDVAVVFILAIVLALIAIMGAVVLLIIAYERSRDSDLDPGDEPYDWSVTDTPTEPESTEPESEEAAETEDEAEASE